MECLISINLFPLETCRKVSPLRRFSNLPQTKNKTLVSLISCFGWRRNVRGCKGGFPLSRNFYVLTSVKFTCVKQKGYDQFMRISYIAEHSRYENFALTRMFYKRCFCDSNIPSSHGWQNRNHFPRFIISNRIQRLNIQALVLQQENLRHTNNMQDVKAFVNCATETELSSLFSVSLSLSWPSLHHVTVTVNKKIRERRSTLTWRVRKNSNS